MWSYACCLLDLRSRIPVRRENVPSPRGIFVARSMNTCGSANPGSRGRDPSLAMRPVSSREGSVHEGGRQGMFTDTLTKFRRVTERNRCSNAGPLRSIPDVRTRNASSFTSPPSSLPPLLRRDALAFLVCDACELGERGGLPRCSPRGTSGRKRVTRLELATSSLARKCSTN